MFGWFGDIADAVKWLIANWWLVAIGVVAFVTAQFWLPAAVRFFTETKLGAALAAVAVAFGGAFVWIRKDRREHEAIGEARAERRMREKVTTKLPVGKPKNEWWLAKKPR